MAAVPTTFASSSSVSELPVPLPPLPLQSAQTPADVASFGELWVWTMGALQQQHYPNTIHGMMRLLSCANQQQTAEVRGLREQVHQLQQQVGLLLTTAQQKAVGQKSGKKPAGKASRNYHPQRTGESAEDFLERGLGCCTKALGMTVGRRSGVCVVVRCPVLIVPLRLRVYRKQPGSRSTRS